MLSILLIVFSIFNLLAMTTCASPVPKPTTSQLLQKRSPNQLQKRSDGASATAGTLAIEASNDPFITFDNGISWKFGLDGNLVAIDEHENLYWTTILAEDAYDCTGSQCILAFLESGDLVITVGDELVFSTGTAGAGVTWWLIDQPNWIGIFDADDNLIYGPSK